MPQKSSGSGVVIFAIIIFFIILVATAVAVWYFVLRNKESTQPEEQKAPEPSEFDLATPIAAAAPLITPSPAGFDLATPMTVSPLGTPRPSSPAAMPPTQPPAPAQNPVAKNPSPALPPLSYVTMYPAISTGYYNFTFVQNTSSLVIKLFNRLFNSDYQVTISQPTGISSFIRKLVRIESLAGSYFYFYINGEPNITGSGSTSQFNIPGFFSDSTGNFMSGFNFQSFNSTDEIKISSREI